jgi:uncharacterized protein (TIGR02001 family)
MKNGIPVSVAVLVFLSSSPLVLAGTSANLAATSNYVARGVTQTQDEPALQGEVKYSADNGLYGGVWASNAKFNGQGDTELDLSIGYAQESKDALGYDVGIVKYVYPEHSSPDYSEAYGKLSYKGWETEVYYTVDSKDAANTVQKGDAYYTLGYTGELQQGWSYAVQVGRDDFKAEGADYNHATVSLTKSVGNAGDFTLAVDKADGGAAEATNTDKDARISLSWQKGFDF